MISLKDCLDYSDLTEEEVDVIAKHEHLPYPYAVELACGMTQSREGEALLRLLLKAAVRDARHDCDTLTLRAARHALEQYAAAHPGR
jgi:hypothetical protein